MLKLTRSPCIHWHDNLLWCCSSYTERLLDGCWSPTRPSVFFVTREDGYMDAWDILYQQRSPVLSFKACIKTSTTSPFTTTFYGLWPWAIPQKFWCYDVKCECLKVSDTPLNAIKVIMRWISLFLYLSILNCFIFSPGSEWGLLGGGGKQWREHQHAAAQLKPQPVQ